MMPIHTPAEMPFVADAVPADAVAGRMLMNENGPYAASRSPLSAGWAVKPVTWSVRYASRVALYTSMMYGSSWFSIVCIWWTISTRLAGSVVAACS